MSMPSPDTAPRRRTQAARSAESEQRLLQAAAEVIAEGGVGAATFEAVGARAGYSRGLATQKFGSKQGMIEALVAWLKQRSDEMMLESGIDTLPGFDAVIGYVDAYLASLADNVELRAYFILLSGAVADRNAADGVFSETHHWVERRIAAFVARGQAQGTIRRDLDPVAVALMVGSLLLGVSTQLHIDPKMEIAPIRAVIIKTLKAAFASA